MILNAVCAASEQACYVTAAESPAVNHLVSFLEMGDSNMHQVCGISKLFVFWKA